MNIEWGDYRITADGWNFILESGRRMRKKTGEVYYQRIRFFSRFNHLLNEMLKDHIKNSDAHTLVELLDTMHESRRKLSELCTGILEGNIGDRRG